jgi:hypothetical protein
MFADCADFVVPPPPQAASSAVNASGQSEITAEVGREARMFGFVVTPRQFIGEC